MEKHPGIRIDRIPVEGWTGLVFVLGIIAIALLGHPAMRQLMLISLVGGIIGAIFLILWHKYH
jgi:hypothetical protein